MDTPVTALTPQLGIVPSMSNDDYHASDAISKSGLWEIYTKTPAHYAYGEREEKKHFDIGTAIHTAILEPNTFEQTVMRGPFDRRGNKWTDAQAEATNTGRLLLTAGDYDDVLLVRDMVHANSWLNELITGGQPMVEHSAFWTEQVGDQIVQCRCRPDLVRADMGLMLDLKTTTDASARAFAKSAAEYGYHAQEAFYTRGWQAAGGCSINATVFLAVEKKKPFAYQIFELPPSAVAEGAAAMSHALEIYAQSKRTGIWQGYGDNSVTQLRFPRWGYKLTEAPATAED